MIPRIAFIGDLTVDVYPQKHRVHLGGSSLNSSMWATRLGAEPSIFAAVGEDAAGKKFLRKLAAEDIGASQVQTLHGKTSNIEIFTDTMGEHRFGEWEPGVLANYHLGTRDYIFLKKQRAASLTIYGPTHHLLEEFVVFGKKKKRRVPLLSVDFGDLSQLAGDVGVVESSIEALDVLFFGLDKDADEEMINTLRQLADTFGKLIVVTLGAYGSIAFQGNQSFIQPVHAVCIKDTTGAGDAFLAGFLVSYLKTRNVQKSLAAGTDLASRVIQKLGAY